MIRSFKNFIFIPIASIPFFANWLARSTTGCTGSCGNCGGDCIIGIAATGCIIFSCFNIFLFKKIRNKVLKK